MASSKGQSFFTNEQLSVLKQAFDQACADLQLTCDRTLQREHLAVLIFQMAAAGETDGATLRQQSVRRFRLGTPWKPIEIGAAADVIALTGSPTGARNHGSGDKS